MMKMRKNNFLHLIKINDFAEELLQDMRFASFPCVNNNLFIKIKEINIAASRALPYAISNFLNHQENTTTAGFNIFWLGTGHLRLAEAEQANKGRQHANYSIFLKMFSKNDDRVY